MEIFPSNTYWILRLIAREDPPYQGKTSTWSKNIPIYMNHGGPFEGGITKKNIHISEKSIPNGSK